MLEKNEQSVQDALSSIEIVLIERAEVYLMQNWQHVVRVMQHLNQMPKETPADVNLQHVRRHFLHQQASLFRQTILLSAFASAEMQALFNGPLCRSHAGSVRFRPIYPSLLRQIPQRRTLLRFERHACDGVEQIADARFAYFKASSLEKLRTSSTSGILLFVPHFFDFLRVCEALSTEGIRHAALSEYTGALKAQKLRREFRDGGVRVLVTTERYYFYNRPRFKAVREVLFYALPEHPHFYNEILRSVDHHPVRATALYSRFSSLQLERIVGSMKARHWLEARGEVVTEALG